MPGNILQINKSKELEWYIGDSKMDDLITHLDKIGYRTSKDKKLEKIREELKEVDALKEALGMERETLIDTK